MKSFKQLLSETKEQLKHEQELRAAAGVPAPGRYLSIGHDDRQFDHNFTNRRSEAKIRDAIKKAFGVDPSQQNKLPHLWAAGPNIKLREGEQTLSVRPVDTWAEIHTDVFPEMRSDHTGEYSPSNPAIYGRVDHIRKMISMNSEHPRFFSSSSIDRIVKELKSRFPDYDVHDMMPKFDKLR